MRHPFEMRWPLWRSVVRMCTLWCRGLWESLQIQRSAYFCLCDRRVLKKCTKNALLNGLVFYGSLVWANKILTPLVDYILPRGLSDVLEPVSIRVIGSVILMVYYALWILPVYVVSLLVSIIWCQDLAEMAFYILEKKGSGDQRKQRKTARKSQDFLDTMSEKMYTMLLLFVFYLEIKVVGLVPFVGPVLSLVFMCWLWAFYCFDYAWQLQGVGLQQRLAIFERNWAFFCGFGLPCGVITHMCNVLTSAAWSGVLFPLLVLVACNTNLKNIDGVVLDENKEKPLGVLDLFPVFGPAVQITHFLVNCMTGKVAAVNSWYRMGLRIVDFLRL